MICRNNEHEPPLPGVRQAIAKQDKGKRRSYMQLHKKMKSAVCVVLAMSLMAAALFSAALMNAKADSGNVVQHSRDPWVDTEVLNYLFWTADTKLSADCVKLQNDLDLTDTIMAQLKSYGLEEGQRLMGTELVSPETTGTKAAVEAVNARQAAVFAAVDKETKEILGPKYPAFRAWIRAWWQEETTYRQNWIREQEDAAHSAATNKTVLSVSVREVGPWNENGNYWDSVISRMPGSG
jgi:hypothetical protein